MNWSEVEIHFAYVNRFYLSIKKVRKKNRFWSYQFCYFYTVYDSFHFLIESGNNGEAFHVSAFVLFIVIVIMYHFNSF